MARLPNELALKFEVWKAYCLAEFDKAEDKKKGLELDISDLGKAIADAKESIATLASEIEALEDGINKLDKSVAEATENRKEEHDDYVETLAANTGDQIRMLG